MFHVTFPGLGLEFTINRIAFTIGSLPVYWYGICIATGMMLALLFAFAKAKEFGINADRMVDVIMLSAVCAIIGARIYYVALAPYKYDSLWDMINLRDGGIAIYGAIIGAFVSGYFFCKWRKVPVLPMFDLAAMGFLLGQGIGRWGNFFNQEAFGTNTTLPWGMYSEGTREYLSGTVVTAGSGVVIDPSMPVHPTFLYESIWCVLGFFLLWAYIRHRKFNGEILLLYVIWYGVERFFVEGLRTDSLMSGFLGLRVSQLVAAISVPIATVVWLYCRARAKKSGEPLAVTYLLTEKELGDASCENRPVAASVTWLASEKPPTDAEIAAQIEAIKNQEMMQEISVPGEEPPIPIPDEMPEASATQEPSMHPEQQEEHPNGTKN